VRRSFSEGRDRLRSVDFKSLVIGGLLVLVTLCAVGAVPWLARENFQRFVVGTTDNSALILDTATGQAWAFDTLQCATFGCTGQEEFFAPKAAFPGHPVESGTSAP
jgi:hypothetical protein